MHPQIGKAGSGDEYDFRAEECRSTLVRVFEIRECETREGALREKIEAVIYYWKSTCRLSEVE
jgi:hypothetical protein